MKSVPIKEKYIYIVIIRNSRKMSKVYNKSFKSFKDAFNYLLSKKYDYEGAGVFKVGENVLSITPVEVYNE